MENKEFITLLKLAMGQQKIEPVKALDEKIEMPSPPKVNLPNVGINMPKIQTGKVRSITPASTNTLWSPGKQKGTP